MVRLALGDDEVPHPELGVGLIRGPLRVQGRAPRFEPLNTFSPSSTSARASVMDCILPLRRPPA